MDRYESQIHDENLVEATNELVSLLLASLPNIDPATGITFQRIISNLEGLEHIYIREDPVTPSGNLHFFNNETITYHEGDRERPRFFLSKEALVGLREIGKTWSGIAEMFSVSRWTVYRRAREYEISHINLHTQINDDDLFEIISNYINLQSRLVGFSLIYGHLCSIGIRVQLARLRELIRRFGSMFSRLR